MNGSHSFAAVAIGSTITRLILAIAGTMTMAWAIVVISALLSERVIVDVAGAVAAGEAFKPEVLAAVDARTESGSRLRSSVLGKAAVIRLRRAENATSSGDPDLLDQRLESLAQIVDEAFQNAPADPFLWLVRFWLDTTRNGLGPDNLRFLRMSYELGPYEGWIAAKRNRFALAAFPALPSDLRELAISEFVGLVRWDFVPEASAIAAGTAPPLRSILFARLKDLSYEKRSAFANAIYRRELDDVPVPGIDPPTPGPMPVFPPNFFSR